ncbi:hypothetical protein IG631_06049 [Alternaria alternata]|nr:hypothetical protein IG631_06049 [Alternaria alternata]
MDCPDFSNIMQPRSTTYASGHIAHINRETSIFAESYAVDIELSKLTLIENLPQDDYVESTRLRRAQECQYPAARRVGREQGEQPHHLTVSETSTASSSVRPCVPGKVLCDFNLITHQVVLMRYPSLRIRSLKDTNYRKRFSSIGFTETTNPITSRSLWTPSAGMSEGERSVRSSLGRWIIPAATGDV